MSNDAYAAVQNSASCAVTRGTLVKNHKDLKLFPATGSLALDEMELLGSLPKTVYGNQHMLVITDWFTKLTRRILRAANASVAANLFSENCTFVYGATRFVLTYHILQFAAKLLDALWALLGVRHYFTTAYHP